MNQLSGEEAKDERGETTGETEAPSTKQLDDILYASFRGDILQAALELKVWEKIGSGQRTLKEIAESEGWDIVGTRMLLDLLCNFGLLTKDEVRYHLVPVAKQYLLPDGPTYMGETMLSDLKWECNVGLAEAIRTGRRPLNTQRTDEESARIWAGWFAPRTVSPYRDIEKIDAYWEPLKIEVHKGMRVLDVACGSGIKTLAFARNHPEILITLQDWPVVLEVALVVAEKLGVRNRVTTIPGDVRSVSLGHNAFDLVWLGYIARFFGPKGVVELLRRVKEAIVPGGILILNEPFRDEIGCQNEDALIDAMWLFIVSKEGDVHTLSEWKGFLEQAGFVNVTKFGEEFLKAMKP
jgi:SAM-dependent methyltransferase